MQDLFGIFAPKSNHMSNEKCNYFSLQISDTTIYIDIVSSSIYIACINYINVVIVKDTHPRLGNKYNWMQRRKESYLNDLCLQIQSTWILDMY